MTWAARLARLSDPKLLNVDSADSVDSVDSPQNRPIGAFDTIDIGVFPNKLPANDAAITTQCARCGCPSPPFALIVNADIWECDACLPSDPDDQAMEATERAAIIGEAAGDARAAVPHAMPPAWPDASMEPTIGARCRLCGGGSWWTECDQPKGWRCLACHPDDYLPADRRRDVVT